MRKVRSFVHVHMFNIPFRAGGPPFPPGGGLPGQARPGRRSGKTKTLAVVCVVPSSGNGPPKLGLAASVAQPENLNLEVRQKIWISILGLKDERWNPGQNALRRRRISGKKVWGALRALKSTHT